MNFFNVEHEANAKLHLGLDIGLSSGAIYYKSAWDAQTPVACLKIRCSGSISLLHTDIDQLHLGLVAALSIMIAAIPP